VAESGFLLAEVRAVKRQDDNVFYLVDAGFNNLARPILYGSYHPMSIVPGEEGGLAPFAPANGACPPSSALLGDKGDWLRLPERPEGCLAQTAPVPLFAPEQDVIVGGPLCESGDIFTQEEGGFVAPRRLPEARVGDLLVIECAGAYGFVMGSNYNSQPLAAEVLIDAGRPRLVRRRQTFEDLIRGEEIPSAT